uniref:Heat shock protein HspQ n=1 Tax=Candidatus Kentrum eta TaxID=2126337 RepID=A0A450VNA4_9GAMM|nr:MAG: hemimethylated DNA binding domain-containing protein [Candidatus Kentron sp. H]VFK06284.1 MAG: hemimethylated DNA binding domain-containing protein [Candidatus Kentron sp. H]
MKNATAKFSIGQIVRHRHFPFRGVIFDVDPIYMNTQEWYESIPPEVRPHKEQPYLPPIGRERREHLYRLRLGTEPPGR